jgi:hypothetical protein
MNIMVSFHVFKHVRVHFRRRNILGLRWKPLDVKYNPPAADGCTGCGIQANWTRSACLNDGYHADSRTLFTGRCSPPTKTLAGGEPPLAASQGLASGEFLQGYDLA